MDFCCFKCSEEFPTCNSAIAHLKDSHVEEIDWSVIPCLVKFKCEREFKSLSGLRKHTEKCLIQKRKSESQKVYVYKYI